MVKFESARSGICGFWFYGVLDSRNFLNRGGVIVYYARHRVVMGTLCSHLPAPVGFECTGAVTRVQVLRDEEILHFY